MILTTTYKKNLSAYLDGYRYIINRGSSRSSKTFSILQLLYQIASNSSQPLVIHVVSHSTPHLKDGAIADFEKILYEENINVESIRTQNPNNYTFNKSNIKFIGFDKVGKSLGAARDILFINEANKMPWEIVHQLIQRTKSTIFIDFNPSESFWVDSQGINSREGAIVINSTFRDNIQNLTEGQISEFAYAKQKHDEEVRQDIKGYWYNYWRVYGCGLDGSLEGTIYNNWTIGVFDRALPYVFAIDWGNVDPLAMVMVAVDNDLKRLYVHEINYKSGMIIPEINELLTKYCNPDDLIVCDHNEPTTRDTLYYDYSWNIRNAVKKQIRDRIRNIQQYQIIVTPESVNLQNELKGYIWHDKRSETPKDGNDHLINAMEYGFEEVANPYNMFC
jgi:phage terminase large subunit